MTVNKRGYEPGDDRRALRAARYSLSLGDGFVEGEPSGIWLGDEEALGLLGVQRGTGVEVRELAYALQGRHAITGAQLRKPGSVTVEVDGKKVEQARVNSFHLAFSVPKSVSVLWSQANRELRMQIERAVIEAAHTALEHVVRTRMIVGGKSNGQGFAASFSMDRVARRARDEQVPSPQLHVHIDLVGVLDSNGKLRTPSNDALYKDGAMREAGAVGRLVLARRMEELGFGVRAETGRKQRYFEIDGVSEELCERLSGRSRDVAGWNQDYQRATGEVPDTHESARAAAETRTSKGRWSVAEMQAGWDEHARALGFGREQIEALRTGRAPVRDVDALRAYVAKRILERIWELGPAVPIAEVRAAVYEMAPLGLSHDDARDVLRDMQQSGELIALDKWMVTSREIRAREEYVRDVVRQAASRGEPGLSAQAVAIGKAHAERSLKGHTLDKEQREAVDKLTSGAGWACLTGRAGTGKGPVLEAAAEAYRRDGWQVVATAVDGATKQRLGAQVTAPAVTIRQMLHRVAEKELTINARTVIVIEEASKVGLRDWAEIARLCEKTRARVLVVGDRGQIGAIEAPGMLDVMLEENDVVPTATLKTVRRHRDPRDQSQTHPWLVDYQSALYEGRAEEAVEILQQQRALNTYATRAEAMAGMVERWHERRTTNNIAAKDAIMIVYGSNLDVDEVNRLAQERRRTNHEVSGPGVRAVGKNYAFHVDDVVMLRAAAYQPSADNTGSRGDRVENGTMGVVTRVDTARERVWVRFDEPTGGPREVMIDQKLLRDRSTKVADDEKLPQLCLAYAGHPFPMQGATFSYVGSLWGHWTQDKESTYSGDTRVKLWLDVHVDEQSLGTRGSLDAKLRRFAKRLNKPTHRVASILLNPAAQGVAIAPRRIDYSELPRQDPLARLRQQARRNVERTDDALQPYLSIVGNARARWLRGEAEGRRRLVVDADREWLEQQAERYQPAMESLREIAAGARSSLRLDRQWRAAYRRSDAAGREAFRLERVGQQAEAQKLRQREKDERLAVIDLQAKVDELRRKGQHVDSWLGDNAEDAVRWLAVQHELAVRAEIDRLRADRGEETARGADRDAGRE